MDNIMMDGMSFDMEQEARDRLRSVFPDCFSDGKLDIDKLLSLCGEYIDNDFEKYKFEWKGKTECLRLARKRSTGTLRPCPEESVNFDSTNNLYIEGRQLGGAQAAPDRLFPARQDDLYRPSLQHR